MEKRHGIKQGNEEEAENEGHLQQAWLPLGNLARSALQQLLGVPRDFKEMRTNAQKSAKMRYYARTDRSLIEKNLD